MKFIIINYCKFIAIRSSVRKHMYRYLIGYKVIRIDRNLELVSIRIYFVKIFYEVLE